MRHKPFLSSMVILAALTVRASFAASPLEQTEPFGPSVHSAKSGRTAHVTCKFSGRNMTCYQQDSLYGFSFTAMLNDYEPSHTTAPDNPIEFYTSSNNPNDFLSPYDNTTCKLVIDPKPELSKTSVHITCDDNIAEMTLFDETTLSSTDGYGSFTRN